MNKYSLIIRILLWGIICISASIFAMNIYHRNEMLNMANTVSPIIEQLSKQKCGYSNIQFTTEEDWAKGGKLIYKREEYEGCISGKGNGYYIRCYDWKWIGDKLYYKPTHDVPLNCRSCIAEKDIRIPYYDKELSEAKIKEIYHKGKKGI